MNSLPGSRSILVTGASGFLGSHLARRLSHDFAGTGKITGVAATAGGACRLNGMPPNFVFALADIRDPETLEALFAAGKFEVVFHLAARGVVQSSLPDVGEMTSVNALGSITVARAAIRHRVTRFVYCGSGLEYEPRNTPVDESVPLGGPNSYGASKATGWLLLDYLRQAAGLPLVTVRPFTVFGPGESDLRLIPYGIGRALRRQPLQLTHGDQIRDYIYVSDVVEALVLAARDGTEGDVFNIGSGPAGARTIRGIVETTLDLMGVPRSLCRFGEAQRLRPDPECLVSDCSRAIARLGWAPRVSLAEGLSRTIHSMTSDPHATAAAA